MVDEDLEPLAMVGHVVYTVSGFLLRNKNSLAIVELCSK